MRLPALLCLGLLLLAGCASSSPPTAAPGAAAPAEPSAHVLDVANAPRLTDELHFLAPPVASTVAPTGTKEVLTPVSPYTDLLSRAGTPWDYTVQRAGVLGTGSFTLHLRALRPVVLLPQTVAGDSCTFVLFINIATADGNQSTGKPFGCKNLDPGPLLPGDLDVQMDLNWAGRVPGNDHVDVQPGQTLSFSVMANVLDPVGGSLAVVSGTPAKDTFVKLPSLRQPVGLLGAVVGGGT